MSACALRVHVRVTLRPVLIPHQWSKLGCMIPVSITLRTSAPDSGLAPPPTRGPSSSDYGTDQYRE